MQVWDVVKVKETSEGHAGEVGVIQHLADGIATVKLDLQDDPIKLPVDEITRL